AESERLGALRDLAHHPHLDWVRGTMWQGDAERNGVLQRHDLVRARSSSALACISSTASLRAGSDPLPHVQPFELLRELLQPTLELRLAIPTSPTGDVVLIRADALALSRLRQ